MQDRAEVSKPYTENFLQFLQQNYQNHSKYKLACNILNSLIEINNALQQENGLKEILEKATSDDKAKNVIRTRHGNLAIHINFGNIEGSTLKLKDDINRLENVCKKIMTERENQKKQKMTSGFLDRLEKSPVGCLEARLEKAETYIEKGGIIFSEILEDEKKCELLLDNDKGQFHIDAVINEFFDDIESGIDSQFSRNETKTEPFTWALLKQYLAKSLIALGIIEDEDENYDSAWFQFRNSLPKPVITMPKKTGKKPSYYFNFATERDAKIYLGFVKSMIPDADDINYAKIIIQGHINRENPYGFRLSESQLACYQSMIGHLEQEEKAKREDKVPVQTNTTLLTVNDAQKTELINQLNQLGCFPPCPKNQNEEAFYQAEFDDFLLRRSHALSYNSQAAQSNSVKDAQQNTTIKQPLVFSYYDEQEYQKKADKHLTHARYNTHLYLTSVGGGREVTGPYNGRIYVTNPFNLPSCPQSNLFVATGLNFASHGGYFGKSETAYSSLRTASLLHAYAYEFENFSAKDIHDGKCPYLTTEKSEQQDQFIELSVNITSNSFVYNGGNTIYLNQEQYTQLIKENLLQQMRAVLHAHKKLNLDNDIQMNLTLSGLGYFANLGGNPGFSIKQTLAPLTAQAYREALEQLSAEQVHHTPKITSLRLSYNPTDSVEKNAIDKAFETTEQKNSVTIKGITVSRTARFVEDLDENNNITQVVCVNGDPRTYAGNEKENLSQEPGIYSNIVWGRHLLSSIIYPFQHLGNAYTHQEIAGLQTAPRQIALEEVNQLQSVLDELQKKYVEDPDHYAPIEALNLPKIIPATMTMIPNTKTLTTISPTPRFFSNTKIEGAMSAIKDSSSERKISKEIVIAALNKNWQKNDNRFYAIFKSVLTEKNSRLVEKMSWVTNNKKPNSQSPIDKLKETYARKLLEYVSDHERDWFKGGKEYHSRLQKAGSLAIQLFDCHTPEELLEVRIKTEELYQEVDSIRESSSLLPILKQLGKKIDEQSGLVADGRYYLAVTLCKINRQAMEIEKYVGDRKDGFRYLLGDWKPGQSVKQIYKENRLRHNYDAMVSDAKHLQKDILNLMEKDNPIKNIDNTIARFCGKYQRLNPNSKLFLILENIKTNLSEYEEKITEKAFVHDNFP